MVKLKYGNLSLEEIEAKIEENEKEVDKIWKNNSSWEDYTERCKPYWKELRELTAAKYLLIPYEDIVFEDMDEFEKDCLETIDSFTQGCKYGFITSDDGHGYYATKDKITNIYAEPYHFVEGYIRPDFEYVVWFNK